MTQQTAETELVQTLYATLKERTGLHLQALRLDCTSKLSSLLANLILSIICLHLFTALLIFLTFQYAYFLATLFGSLPLAIFMVIATYAVLIFILFINRKRWILYPITRCLLHMFDMKTEASAETPLQTIERQRESLKVQLATNQEVLVKNFNEFISPTPPASPFEKLGTFLNWGSHLIKGIKMGYNFIKNRQ